MAAVASGQVFTEFVIPTAGSDPTTTGVFMEFPILTAGSFPYGIVAGSDGNLWPPNSTSVLTRSDGSPRLQSLDC